MARSAAEPRRTGQAGAGGIERVFAQRWAKPAARRDSPFVASVIRVGLALALAAVVVQTVAHLVNAFLLDRAVELADVRGEGDLDDWATSAVTFVGSVFALLTAVLLPERRRGFAGLAVLLAYFSLDDALELHEKLAERVFVGILGTPESLGGKLFPALYLPLLVLAFLLLLRASEAATQRGRLLVLYGLALLVAAIAVEFVSAALAVVYSDFDDSALAALVAAIEEAVEVSGWSAVVLGLFTAVPLEPRDASTGSPPNQA